MSKNLIERESDDHGYERFSELCWDGKRRITATISPKSKMAPGGMVNYLERFVSAEMLHHVTRRVEPETRRCPCDYL